MAHERAVGLAVPPPRLARRLASADCESTQVPNRWRRISIRFLEKRCSGISRRSAAGPPSLHSGPAYPKGSRTARAAMLSRRAGVRFSIFAFMRHSISNRTRCRSSFSPRYKREQGLLTSISPPILPCHQRGPVAQWPRKSAPKASVVVQLRMRKVGGLNDARAATQFRTGAHASRPPTVGTETLMADNAAAEAPNFRWRSTRGMAPIDQRRRRPSSIRIDVGHAQASHPVLTSPSVEGVFERSATEVILGNPGLPACRACCRLDNCGALLEESTTQSLQSGISPQSWLPPQPRRSPPAGHC